MEALEKAHALGLFQPGTYWAELWEYPRYLVGAHGEVMSLHGPKPKILSPIKRGKYDGYTLRHRDGTLKPVYRHRLVAEMMHGPCPEGMECRHLDGDETNADSRNLAWGTHQENINDMKIHGTTLTGERNPQAKLTAAIVSAMKHAREETGASYRKIGEQFGVSTMTAYRAIVGESWK